MEQIPHINPIMNAKINVIRNVNTDDTNAVVTASLICLSLGPDPVHTCEAN